jgi:hypothetical protein
LAKYTSPTPARNSSYRYPVEIQHAVDIDDQSKLMEAINGDAQLKAAGSASPKLRAAIKA